MTPPKFLQALLLALVLPATAAAAGDNIRAGWTATDFSHHQVGLDKISMPAARRNLPPAVTKPELTALQSESEIGGLEPVIAVEINGVSHAYPLQILARHEIINDVVGGVPVLVTFCPYRKSAAVFDRRLGGRVLEFANTGGTHDSNILLYDTETQSWWQQINGTAIVGAFSGQRLKLIPARLQSFAQFKARIPAAEAEQASVMAPTALSRRPVVQTDADNLIIPVEETGEGKSKMTLKDRVVVVGEEGWNLSVLQRLGTTPQDSGAPVGPTRKDKKNQPLKVYYKNGTLQVPYQQDDETRPKDK